MSHKDYRKFEPYPEEEMGFRNPKKTICELLRKTYRISKEEQVRLNIRIAMSMAKRMGEKLHWYRKNCPTKIPEELNGSERDNTSPERDVLATDDKEYP